MKPNADCCPPIAPSSSANPLLSILPGRPTAAGSFGCNCKSCRVVLPETRQDKLTLEMASGLTLHARVMPIASPQNLPVRSRILKAPSASESCSPPPTWNEATLISSVETPTAAHVLPISSFCCARFQVCPDTRLRLIASSTSERPLILVRDCMGHPAYSPPSTC